MCHTLNKVQNIAPVGVGKELSIADLESRNWFDEGLAYFRAEASVGNLGLPSLLPHISRPNV